MIELVDTFPDVNIDPAEYVRLLGYPREHVLAGRARELAQAARAWYGKHGRPWVYARQCDALNIVAGSDRQITIDGVAFSSPRLHKTLREADANGVFLVAVSAGPEAEAEAQRLWLEEKPDEYFFMEMYASAVVEHLTTATGARLCGWADRNDAAILPHYSPGYPEWDISQQPALLNLLRGVAQQRLPERIDALSSGMLRPKKSLLAVFGVTTHTEHVRRLTDLVPCENCSFANCQFRRVPYGRGTHPAELQDAGTTPHVPLVQITTPLERAAKYVVNAKALQRWSNERLTLKTLSDGNTEALFRYEGTTCSNTGRAIFFNYKVKIGTRSQGYPLLDMLCSPAPDDEGHKFMCRYMSNPEHLMVAIDHERPLMGKPLNDVLTWQRPKTGAGCYCEPNSRQHKWGLVLETIHHAIVERELTAEAATEKPAAT